MNSFLDRSRFESSSTSKLSDVTEEEILDKWWRPRYLGYGKAIGVELKISDMDENGKITVELA